MKKVFLTIALLFVSFVIGFAQSAGFQVISGHPDFKIKVQRCESSGSICVIDLILENVGGNDVNIGFLSANTVAYDDEANQYHAYISLNGKALRDSYEKASLPAYVPIKARIQIENLAPAATMFRRIDMNFYCDEWRLGIGDIGWGMMNKYNKTSRLLNVPISREGDD